MSALVRMHSMIRSGSLTVLVAALFCLTPGCSGPADPDEQDPSPQDPVDFVNSDKPNSNEQMVSEVVTGEEGEWSTLWEVVRESSGGFYYRGGVNSRYGGGHLDVTGNQTWHCRTSHSPRGMCTTGPTAAVPNALITVGGYDTDDDGHMDLGQISLATPSGTLVNTLVYSSDTSRMSFFSVVGVSDSNFLALGGVIGPEEITAPFVALFSIAPSGQLEKQSDVVISSLPGMTFDVALRDPEGSSESEAVLFVSSYEGVAEALHKIRLPLPDLAAATVEWTREVAVPSSPESEVSSLAIFDGNLYWVGRAEDPAKEPVPGAGGYWDSGAAGSLTLDGQLRWVRLIGVTGHSERLYGIVVSGESLYALGTCGGYVREKQEFGYGWICKIERNTGSPVSHMTFGDEKNRSGFNDAVLDGSMMHCVGWTRQEVSGMYQAWFCTIDMSAEPIEAATARSAPLNDAHRDLLAGRRTVDADGGRR